MSLEDDTYSSIFTALKHPIRRKILRILDDSPATYTEIQRQIDIDNGLLNYHLENMKDLTLKTDEGRYRLSEYGRAAVGITQRVEEPTNSQKFRGLSGKQQAAGVVVVAAVVLSLIILNFNLNNSIQSQGSTLSQVTAELDRLTDLIPLGELANVSKPPTVIVSAYTMLFNYNRPTIRDESTSIIVFYVPVDGSIARLELFVDSLNKYELDLTLQRGNAWRNQTWVRLGTVNQVYNLNLTTSKGSRIVWQSPIVWSMKVSETGVYETPPMSKGWYTFSIFGPITVLDNGDFYRYPWFRGASDDPHSVGKLDSYKVIITFTVQKEGECNFFAVTNERF